MFGHRLKELKEQDKCDYCMYVAFDTTTNTIWNLQCRRFPPKVHKNETGTFSTYFPTIGYHDWCGEFQSRRGSAYRRVTSSPNERN